MNRASLRGIEMAYDDVGSGPSVVLLHGYPFNRSLWRGQVELCARTIVSSRRTCADLARQWLRARRRRWI